jgi:hypothetical protein
MFAGSEQRTNVRVPAKFEDMVELSRHRPGGSLIRKKAVSKMGDMRLGDIHNGLMQKILMKAWRQFRGRGRARWSGQSEM